MNVYQDDGEWDNDTGADGEEEDDDQPQGYHALLDPEDEE
jgi:hypothetical protein